MEEQDLLHEVLSSIRDVIKDTRDDIKEIKTDISAIKIDVAHHIMRTDMLQDDQKNQKEIVDQLQRDSWRLKGILGFLGFVLMLLATWGAFFHKT